MDLAMLNRLRVNAGKPELRSWKASKAKLEEAITKLREEGFLDTLPGANINAAPVTDDPALAKARPEPEPPADEPPVKKDPETRKIKPALARGADNGLFTEHSRKAVRDHRQKEKAKEKADRKEAKKAAKPEPVKKDEDKAERQKKHIEEKRAKRAAEGKLKPAKEKDPNKVSAADIARDVGMDPKIARAKLRRHTDRIKKAFPKWDGSWEFPKAAEAEIKKILKGEK